LPSPTLSGQEIDKALEEIPGWRRSSSFTSNSIFRVYEFPDFAKAMIFVNKVAEAAEAANHHPDIDIRYNKVTMALTSHDSGGVTARDVKMAKKINEIG
jgi:4a-hydroxytetrahydrobiopterin dehydratase